MAPPADQSVTQQPAASAEAAADWVAEFHTQQVATEQPSGRAPPLQNVVGIQQLVSAEQQCSMVAEALERLAQHGTGSDVDDTPDDIWLEKVTEIALSDDMFQAGNFGQHVAAFESFFKAAGASKYRRYCGRSSMDST
jgi:hypothetical protein